MDKSGGLAFPYARISHGMALRQYYKAAALQGLLSNAAISKALTKDKWNADHTQEWHAQVSGQMADAMIAEDAKFLSSIE